MNNVVKKLMSEKRNKLIKAVEDLHSILHSISTENQELRVTLSVDPQTVGNIKELVAFGYSDNPGAISLTRFVVPTGEVRVDCDYGYIDEIGV
jgi:hypothetical protein